MAIFDSFLSDEKTMDAVVRNFEIIGEAANRIDPDFRDKNPEIEWKRIRGFRNRIVHDYFGIDYEIVWEVKKVFQITKPGYRLTPCQHTGMA